MDRQTDAANAAVAGSVLGGLGLFAHNLKKAKQEKKQPEQPPPRRSNLKRYRSYWKMRKMGHLWEQ